MSESSVPPWPDNALIACVPFEVARDTQSQRWMERFRARAKSQSQSAKLIIDPKAGAKKYLLHVLQSLSKNGACVSTFETTIVTSLLIDRHNLPFKEQLSSILETQDTHF